MAFLVPNFLSQKLKILNQEGRVLGASWYDHDWDYRNAITIDHTKVSNTDQTDFPVLINSTNSDWRDTEHGGKVAQADGDDILFTSSDGTTKLSHEIEKYDNTTGELVAWVKVPTLSASEDTVIYIYYGNSTCSNQQDPTNVWDSNYVGVWHLGDAGPTYAYDSTSNNHTGSQIGGVTFGATGKIGDCTTHNANYIQLSSDLYFPQGSSDRTLTAWVYATQLGNFNHIIHYGTASTGKAWGLALRSGLLLAHEWSVYQTAGTVPLQQWTYVGITLSDGGNKTHYINGVSVGTPSYTPNTVLSGVCRIGSRISTPTEYFYGNIDEVRISNTARSASWIATEYNNQNNPESFYTIGEEEAY